jgi:AraC-like DNA-binding protein
MFATMRGAESSDATVSSMMFRPILMALERAGIDVKAFAADNELPLDAIADRDARLPRELAIRTWLAAGEATNDDVLGLHIATRAPPGMYGALEYAIRSNATVGDALLQFARYYRIVSSSSALVVDVTDTEARVTHAAARTPPAVVDNLFALIVRVGRELSGVAVVPRSVKLTRSAPRVAGDHDAFFRVPVEFSAPVNELVFDAATLALPFVTADAALHEELERRTEAMLGGLPAGAVFLRDARVAVMKSLREGTGATVAVLAAALDMSERTLQRRLGENATSRSDLVDSVRHELALRYLAADVGSTEAAYMLGFSEATAFHRAFKRWTGTTLKEYRARLR